MRNMSNKIKVLLGTGVLFSTMIVPVMAAEPSSNAKVTFTAPDTQTPVDPVDPGEGGDGNETGSTGPLTIDYVPNFKFEETEIDGTVKTLQSTSLKPFVQVTDRSASGKGWKLSATMGDFKNGTHSISTAKLTLKDGVIEKVDDANNATAPTTNSSIELTSGTPKTIMNAKAQTGMGSWLSKWFATGTTNEKAILEIDSSTALAGEYTSVINWELTQQPE